MRRRFSEPSTACEMCAREKSFCSFPSASRTTPTFVAMTTSSPPPRQHDAEERLAAAEAVVVAGVEERDAELARAADGGERLVVVRLSPPNGRAPCVGDAADGPAAEADLRDGDAGVAELPVMHVVMLRHTRNCRTSLIAGITRNAVSASVLSGESMVMIAIAVPPLSLRARLYSAMFTS